MDPIEERGEFIEIGEEGVDSMFAFLLAPDAEMVLPEGFGFDTLFGKDFYEERFPGFSDEAYTAMAQIDQNLLL